ncbi:uncharacterized protein LOC123430716 [Hordeum vulgare subsp. vulgare]|uniref:uncharacterized protein LOC123430716 n=1 Tax=Hordeum vulgare subsp. vulgare TaxID=112509 RepID=UPI001D1A490B|nr:uncharacterized protein LOC123430716 [Hordeum vulgare subsp. vulgare]
MGFIMEFTKKLILWLMEDPEQRAHVYLMKERCERTKAAWALPLRPYGLWTFDRFNSQLSSDPKISQVVGRRDHYDDLLARHANPALPPSSSS